MKAIRMENKNASYYTLKYLLTDTLHKKGEVVVVPTGELRIGQQDDCKVLFHNNTDYEDELYAIIRPTRMERDEWQLIPASEYIKTSVNGNPIDLVHYLNNGDRITFEGEEQELLFETHRDGKYNAALGIQMVAAPISRRLIACLIAIPVLLFSLIAGYIIKDNYNEEQREKLLADLHTSILQISVDTVQYIEVTSHGERILRKYSYQKSAGHIINGTAFLTSDSCMVTARHCIEPWLNDPMATEANKPKELKSIPSRWAMEAETYNQTHNTDTIYKVVTICNIFTGKNGTEGFGKAIKSTDFFVDRSRDIIIEKGDFNEVFYWRSIKETYSNKDVMLGDVAWTRTNSVGKITLATDDELSSLLANRQQLYFMGYPDHNTIRGFNTEEGKLQMDYVKGSVIVHNGNLIHGYSGAPVIIINKQKAYAVGVVSRIDANGGGRTYSVPVTELFQKGGKK